MNKGHSHCCVHNKAHKLMEDKVNGWVCLCASLHPSMCEGKKPVLQKNFQCWTKRGRLSPDKTKTPLKASERRKPKAYCGSVGASRCTDSIGSDEKLTVLNLEQHVHPKNKKQNHICPSLLSNEVITSDVWVWFWSSVQKATCFWKPIAGQLA